jgi:hypothetical protein
MMIILKLIIKGLMIIIQNFSIDVNNTFIYYFVNKEVEVT